MTAFPVSLVVVTHNSAPWLQDCINSIAAQSMSPIEVIFIDVASTWKTRWILATRVGRIPHASVIRLRENVGGAAAANLGIRSATGEYVFVMDSDDVLPSDAIERLYVAAASSHNDVTIGRALAIVDGTVVEPRYRADTITWARPLSVTSVEQYPPLTMAPYYWGRLYRREMLIERDVFMQPGRLYADRYFSCKALIVSDRTEVIDATTYLWRRDHSESRSPRSVTQKTKNLDALADRVKGFAEVEGLFDAESTTALRSYVRLSNLMRLFIHTKHLDELGGDWEGLRRVLLPYARSFAQDEVAECEFLLARHKIQWYLIVNERWDGLLEFQSLSQLHRVNLDDRRRYDLPATLGEIPSEIRTEFRHSIGQAHAAWSDSRRDLDVTVALEPEMEVDFVNVTLKATSPENDVRLPVSDVSRQPDAANFSVRVPQDLGRILNAKWSCGYIMRGRYSEKRLKLKEPDSVE